mgnify:FL=1
MKKENKVLKFILSLFVPRKMAERMNMNFFVSLLLVLVASFLNVSTSNANARKEAIKGLAVPELFTSLPDNYKIEGIPSVDYGNEDNAVIAKSNTNGVYSSKYVLDDSTLNIDVVIATDLKAASTEDKKDVYLDNFDLEGYFKQEYKEKNVYVLYVVTKDAFFYILDLGRNTDGTDSKDSVKSYVYETVDNKGTEYQYYLPASEDELKINAYGDFDTTLWTKKCSADDKIDFEVTNAEYIGLKDKIVPVTRHLRNLYNALFGSNYEYEYLRKYGVELTLMKENFQQFQNSIYDYTLYYYTNTIKTFSLVISLVITVLFSLIIAFITWLLSKSLYMKKFRQYYAVASLCFLISSIVGLIAGFFVTYMQIAFYLLLFAAIYFLIATICINGIPNKKNNNGDNHNNNEGYDNKVVEEPEVQTIKEEKPGNDSAQIG